MTNTEHTATVGPRAISSCRNHPGYYVIDHVTAERTRRCLSGPWPSAAAAEADRVTWNIAGDLIVARLTITNEWRAAGEAGFATAAR